ncbi:MAG: PH domain-containing protein [Luteolibacter sp.]
MKKNIFIGCGALLLLAGIGFVAALVWLLSGPESGVKLKNEMDPYALTYLTENNILTPDEELIAYYDATMGMDGTEAAILTNQRVIYHHNGTNDSIALSDIADIQHRKESIIGDIIEIYSISGTSMKIEIAALNQGETFHAALMRAWEYAKGTAPQLKAEADPTNSNEEE